MAMVDEIHLHRQAQSVRQQDELLTHVIGDLSRRSQKLHSREPLGLREAHLAGELMEVPHQGRHDLAQTRIGGGGKAAKNFVCKSLLLIGCTHAAGSLDLTTANFSNGFTRR